MLVTGSLLHSPVSEQGMEARHRAHSAPLVSSTLAVRCDVAGGSMELLLEAGTMHFAVFARSIPVIFPLLHVFMDHGCFCGANWC